MLNPTSKPCLTASVVLPSPQGTRASRALTLRLEIIGDWQLRVAIDEDSTLPTSHGRQFELCPASAATVAVEDEPCGPLPAFNPKVGGWARGYRLRGLRTQETTAGGLLEPGSLVLRTGPGSSSRVLQPAVDYEADLEWGTIGRSASSTLAVVQPVFASYRHGSTRLDSIMLTAEGRVVLRQGEAHPAAPAPPVPAPGEIRLANLYIAGRVDRLALDHLFPVLESLYPQPPRRVPPLAATRLPRSYAKLMRGEPLRVLAWGDSVTEATYLNRPDVERWQAQLVECLSRQFAQARIELMTEAWGGRNTDSYLHEPPGSPHNYQEKVLAARPDLIISEFVNDGGFTGEKTMAQYARLRADFRGIGAEWIILTPHYVKPDWMGLTRQRDVDDDPRAYVQALRQFAKEHTDGLALADAAQRYGRLWRQGVPYMTLMLNAINHPNPEGMRIFADSVMALF